ncbi:hypothetical protein HDF16_000369 [Granulicella aggregans]|uniref:Uncharacterized protein n=1 Tax=Granulicella aggregans TaxID=474949 RepID=A0A7W8E318_9BACT|nr:hypothetical protein [Granulicella aggregans]MBB5055700.1 hypothetical protein [Granulicella aggregans]
MNPVILAIWFSFVSTHATIPHRAIDRCAQDGAYFYAMDDDPAKPIRVERDGVAIRIERHDPKSTEAVLSFQRDGKTLVQNIKDFEAAQGWLTVSRTGAFATTWKENASSAETQLFRVASAGSIIEDRTLVQLAENKFVADAKLVCKTPGINTTAIKWLDDDHLLLAINAWSSGVCSSDFTEGFIISLSKHEVEKKLTESELLNLPAVCTWNLVPVRKQ